jgi:hypothetical protein
VELVLKERCQSLLYLIEALDAPTAIKDEHFDVQLQRVLQLAWLVTVRAFASSTTHYVGHQYHKGRCFIGETKDCAESTTQIHVDTYEALESLFTQMIRNLEAMPPKPSKTHVNGFSKKVDTHAMYNTTIVYRQQFMRGSENGVKACMNRCHACCPQPIAENRMRTFLRLG